MREYELLYIVSGDKTESEAQAAQEAVKKILADHKASITAEDDWGRRRLAYEIKHQSHGWYVVLRFTVEPQQTPEIERALQLSSDLVRVMLINAEELPTAEEKAAQEARAEQYRAKSDDEEKKPAKPAPKPKAATADASEASDEEAEKPTPKVDDAKPAPSDDERKAQLDEKLGQILSDDSDESDDKDGDDTSANAAKRQ